MTGLGIVPGDRPKIGMITSIENAPRQNPFKRKTTVTKPDSFVIKIILNNREISIKLDVVSESLIPGQKVFVYGAYHLWGGVRGLRLEGKINGWLVPYRPPIRISAT
jgi:hypothetical protein